MDLKIKKSTDPIQKFINRARQLALTKDKKWLGRFIDKFTIQDFSGTSIGGDVRKAPYKENLFSMMDIMEGMYSDNWDIHIENIDRRIFSLSFIIRYKEITISNSNNLSRLLRELIVILPLNFDTSEKVLSIHSVWGTRAHLTREELAGQYHHSHLHSRSDTYTQYRNALLVNNDFCLGGGDLNSTIALTRINYDPLEFELLLIQINNHMGWESLSGGPYVKMETLVRNPNTSLYSYDSHHASMVFNTLQEYSRNNDLEVNFYVSNNRYKIKLDKQFHDFVRRVLILQNIDLATQLLLKKLDRGYISFINDTAHIIPNTETQYNLLSSTGEIPYTYISGERIEMTIAKQITNTEQEVMPELTEYSFHPQLLKYVISKLEYLYYEAAIKGSAIREIYKISNA